MLSPEPLVSDVEAALAELPVIDSHMHLTGEQLGARGCTTPPLPHGDQRPLLRRLPGWRAPDRVPGVADRRGDASKDRAGAFLLRKGSARRACSV
jgi:hypothetical protein